MNSSFYLSDEFTQHKKSLDEDLARKKKSFERDQARQVANAQRAANGPFIPGTSPKKIAVAANLKQLPKTLGNTLRARQDRVIQLVNESVKNGTEYEVAFRMVMAQVNRGEIS